MTIGRINVENVHNIFIHFKDVIAKIKIAMSKCADFILLEF